MNQELLEAYRALTPTSRTLYERACRSLPYGNTRDPVWREPYPLYADRGEGAFLIDVDGNRYLDWWNNATSLVLGHAHPAIVSAVTAQAAQGMSFAAPTALEIELAERIRERLPSAERVRFTNSGTEAVMLAIHVARAATGRTKIIKFEGAYHGYYDPVAISVTPTIEQAGDVTLPNRTLEGRGISRRFAADTVVLPWNDVEAVAEVANAFSDDIAAILVEPVANKQGVLTPESGYLEGLRSLADAHGIVLIFDEVVAFRVSLHGAQGLYKVHPDLTTLGKIIGGGLPVGAVAGRWGVMRHLKRGALDGVSHMGTFNANPMTMAAGIATLDLLTPELFTHLDTLGERTRDGLRRVIAEVGVPWQVTGTGSLFKIHLHRRPLRNYRDTLPRPREQELELVTRLLIEGHVFPYNVAGAVTCPMTMADVDGLVAAVRHAAAAMRGVDATSEVSI